MHMKLSENINGSYYMAELNIHGREICMNV
jgi:hypothetical protein